MKLRIEKVTKRYWWPHAIYKEAARHGYNCLHKTLPCADLGIGFRYFINDVEVDLFGNTLRGKK